MDVTSQARFWTLSSDEISQVERDVYERARERLQAIHSTVAEPFPTLQETRDCVYWTCLDVSEMARKLAAPTRVAATAVAFYRRYFLLNSVFDHAPAEILWACVFLASKVENHYISLDKFLAAAAEIQRERLLELELHIVENIQFHLNAHSPLLALHGIMIGGTKYMPADAAKWTSVYAHAKAQCLPWLCTNLLFMYRPADLAAALFAESAAHLSLADLWRRYAESAFPDAEKREEVLSRCRQISAQHRFLSDSATPTAAQRERLQRWRNPEWDPGHAQYGHGRSQELEETHKRKVGKRKASVTLERGEEQSDPFA